MADDKKRPLPRDTEYYSLDGKHISDEQAFTSIANATMQLRAAFIRAGLEPPKCIEIGKHEDGYRLRHILPRDMVMAHAAEGRSDRDPDVVFTIMGVEFRYPAAYRSLRGGGFDII